MLEDARGTVLLICDVWDNHYCEDLRRRTESLVQRVNEFAATVRAHGGKVLHCPSGTVESYYGAYPQRAAMRQYPFAGVVVPQEMRQIGTPLDTTMTGGCPDLPQCRVHSEFTKQHDGIEIREGDLISDNGQEIYNLLIAENVERVLMAGTAVRSLIHI